CRSNLTGIVCSVNQLCIGCFVCMCVTCSGCVSIVVCGMCVCVCVCVCVCTRMCVCVWVCVTVTPPCVSCRLCSGNAWPTGHSGQGDWLIGLITHTWGGVADKRTCGHLPLTLSPSLSLRLFFV